MSAYGPPAKEDPRETWVRFTELPRPRSGEIELLLRGARVAGDVTAWLLTAKEMSGARIAAERESRAIFGVADGSPGRAEDADQRWASKILALALRRGDEPLFRGDAQLRELLTEDEQGQLFGEFVAFSTGFGPAVTNLTKDELDAWVAHLARGAEQMPIDAVQWGSVSSANALPGVDGSYLLDCHFLAWLAARKVLYPEK